MARPATKAELLERMVVEFDALIDLVEAVDPAAREKAGACDEWSIKDLLAHLDVWHRMLLGWEAEGRPGGKPEIPAPGYTWSETPALNEVFFQAHRNDAYADVVASLRESHAQVRLVVESYGAEELFEKKRYAWTGTTSVGSYLVSCTTSHYDWATKLIKRFVRQLG